MSRKPRKEHSEFADGGPAKPEQRRRPERPKLEPPAPVVDLDLAFLGIGDRRIDGQTTVAQAIVAKLAKSALNGNLKAALTFLGGYGQAQCRVAAIDAAYFQSAVNYKQRAADEIAHTVPEARSELQFPLPHPDDVQVDVKHGGVIINGPIDEIEKRAWDEAAEHRRFANKMIPLLRRYLRRYEHRNPNLRGRVEADIASFEVRLGYDDLCYPAEEVRRAPGFDLAVHKANFANTRTWQTMLKAKATLDLAS